MDENKRIKLKEIGYQINECCAICKYSRFPINDWGYCSKHNYDHKKHDGIHELSIHKFGSCDRFEIDENKKHQFGKFEEFITL